ncbi:MAG: DUF87 domain-containing protein [Mycoplasmataceae bacterium]|nr:DUF87 domain-containing protein [Mycoplasmataceae bacterium]
MARIDKNRNYIDDPKGRKWSWGSVKFIGEFTLIDFLIISFFVLLITPLFIFAPIWISLLITFISFFFSMLMIKEVKGNKLYELIYDYFYYFWTSKDLNVLEFIEDKDSISVYEITSGFDISNLTEKNKIDIERNFSSLYQKINGELKIIKTSTTYRLDESLKEMGELIFDEKRKIAQEIKASYYENLDLFTKSKMPNIYLRFDNMDEIDIKIALKEIEELVEFRKLNSKEWQAIIFLEFGKENNFKVKRNRIIGKNSGIEKSIVKINFQRNVPSLFMNEYIYNENTSFIIDFKTPDFKEIQKVKKSIKKWGKEVEGQIVEGKNFIDKVNDASKKEAKNEIMMNYLFGKDELKFMNAYIIFTKDEDSKLSFKKQIEVSSFDSQFKTNFNLNPLQSKQKQFLRNVWFERNEKRWFPTNSSTITNMLPFQNESILNSKGAYIGTSGIAKFPFMFRPFRKKGISGFHTGIISKTGGGKSTLLKMLMAADYSIDETRFMIMDPKNEFKVVMDSIKGKNIDVSRTALNPLKIVSNKKENFEFDILDKVSEIKEFLYLILSRETKTNGEVSEKISAFSDVIKLFFESKKNLILKGKEFIFEDLEKWLKINKNKQFDNLISKFTKGALSRFNKKDEVDFGKDSFNFELLHVKNIKDEATRNAIMFSITSKVIDEIYKNQVKQQKISFVIDEAGWFFKSKFLAEKIEAIMVEARAFNTKLTWATQNVTDLINNRIDNDKLISIYSNTEHMFLGQVKLPQRSALNELLESSGGNKLSKSELEWIEDSDMSEDKGKFLYQRGGISKKIKVDLHNNYAVKKFFFEEHQFTKEE